MQIIDSNDFYLRTGVIYFKNRNADIYLEFVIIPVFHIGTSAFYDDVKTTLNECDLVLFEGIPSNKITSMTGNYSAIARRLNLVDQRNYLTADGVKAHLVHCDFSRESFQQEWKKAPWFSRLLFKYLYPLLLRFYMLSMTRQSFAKHSEI